MSCLVYHTIADNDFGNVCVFSGYYDDVNEVTTKDILSDVNAKGMLPMGQQPTIAVKAMQSGSPVIGYPAGSVPAGSLDLTPVYNFILQVTGGDMESFKNPVLLKKIKDQLVVAFKSADLANLMFKLMMAQVIWELNDYTDFKSLDTEYKCSAELLSELAINDISRGSWQNATVKQDSCTDKLFIELPSYYELVINDDFLAFSKLPVKDQLCTLYTDDRMYTLRYMEACRDNKSKLLEVIGDPKNNTMRIFDNEQEFYDAVMHWINANMKKAETKTIDFDTQQYLFLLIYQMYILNWGHCVRVPLRMLAESSGSSDEFAESDGASRFIMRQECVLGDNACMSLKEFLTDSVAAYGYEILVNILIQMCRWGARKPSCLVVGTDAEDLSDRVFDLNEGIVKIQRQVKGELVAQDPDKFVCVGEIFAKPGFAVGYVRKVVYRDETNAEFPTMYPVFFGDYLADFDQAGKEFVMEQNAQFTLVDVLGTNYAGYVNEVTRKYVSLLGTENITLPREFNAISALNTVLANGTEKLAAYKVNSPSDIFKLANNLMISIQVVACFNYFREYVPVFSMVNDAGADVTYETWKSAIEKSKAVLGSFDTAKIDTSAVSQTAVNPAPQPEAPQSVAQLTAAPQQSAVFGAVSAATSTPTSTQASTQGNAQAVVKDRVSGELFYLRSADNCTTFYNVKLKGTTVCQVGTWAVEINGKYFAIYDILDPANRRNIPDTPETTKSIFTILGHVVHAFNAIAVAPQKQRVFFENTNAFKAFASSVLKLDALISGGE